MEPLAGKVSSGFVWLVFIGEAPTCAAILPATRAVDTDAHKDRSRRGAFFLTGGGAYHPLVALSDRTNDHLISGKGLRWTISGYGWQPT
jgi:hypothetical protein